MDSKLSVANKPVQSLHLATFMLGGELFGVEVSRVQEVLLEQSLTPVPLAPVHVRGLMNLRGQIVPAIDLRTRFEVIGERPNEHVNVVVNMPDGSVSLLVDEIGDVMEVPLDICELPPDTLSANQRHFIVQVCKLERKILAVLDVDRIVNDDIQLESVVEALG